MSNFISAFIGKIVTNFRRHSDPKLYLKSTVIYNSMNLNPSFPTPEPDMPSLNTAITDFSQALVSAQSRDSNAVLVKNQKRASLIMLMESLAQYVTFTAKNDVVALGSTGFDLAKAPEPVTISAPQNVTLADGLNAGELVIKGDAVKGAKYLAQITSAPLTAESLWVSYPSTSRTYTFNGLEKSRNYVCRLGAVGSRNQLVFSEPVSRVSQ